MLKYAVSCLTPSTTFPQEAPRLVLMLGVRSSQPQLHPHLGRQEGLKDKKYSDAKVLLEKILKLEDLGFNEKNKAEELLAIATYEIDT